MKGMLIFIEQNSYFAIAITTATTFKGIIAIIIISITESNYAIIVVAAITKLLSEVIAIATIIIAERGATFGIATSAILKQSAIVQF